MYRLIKHFEAFGEFGEDIDMIRWASRFLGRYQTQLDFAPAQGWVAP